MLVHVTECINCSKLNYKCFCTSLFTHILIPPFLRGAQGAAHGSSLPLGFPAKVGEAEGAWSPRLE